MFTCFIDQKFLLEHVLICTMSDTSDFARKATTGMSDMFAGKRALFPDKPAVGKFVEMKERMGRPCRGRKLCRW
jgi:hypothetical protein